MPTSARMMMPSGIYHELLVDRLLCAYPPRGRALEVGCGSGEYLEKLAALGCHGKGIDLSSRSVEAARERVGGFGFEIEQVSLFDLREPPFDDVYVFALILRVSQSPPHCACRPRLPQPDQARPDLLDAEPLLGIQNPVKQLVPA